MHLIKFGHACVRVEHDGRALVVDPGTWTDPSCLDGAEAVLVTHEHEDHVDVAMLAGFGGKVFAPASIAPRLPGDVTTVASGQVFSAAGLPVEVVGGAHAEIYDGLPGCENVGFVVGEGEASVYHPGDSLFVPAARVGTLLVPASGPWLKLGEALEFVRAAAPRQALRIHDGMANERGLASFDRWMQMKGGTRYTPVADGDAVTAG